MTRVIISMVLCVAALTSGCASTSSGRNAQTLAAADGASSIAMLTAPGIAEANPLAATSVGGIVAMTAFKMGFMKLAEEKLSPSEREKFHRIATSSWLLASVNNLLLIAGASSGLALAAGAMMAVVSHQNKWSLYGQSTAKVEPVKTGQPLRPEELKMPINQPPLTVLRPIDRTPSTVFMDLELAQATTKFD